MRYTVHEVDEHTHCRDAERGSERYGERRDKGHAAGITANCSQHDETVDEDADEEAENRLRGPVAHKHAQDARRNCVEARVSATMRKREDERGDTDRRPGDDG